MNSVFRSATAIVVCMMVVPCLLAATPERDWPSVEVTPIMDVPMRDTAITRGPDGTYYLTGTLQGRAADGSLDFESSAQIKLWKSADLKQWEELGVVWDLDQDVLGPKGDRDHVRVGWMRQAHKDPSRADNPVRMGLKSPELHSVKGDWYICFSMNDQGTGLLKSATGKPEGPYAAHAQITLRHGDPTIFQDDDGSVYWLFGDGWIAKMNDDLTAIVERPRLLTTMNQRPPHFARGKKGVREFHDYPLTVGDHGVFLFKSRGRYYLTAAERTNRMNASCDDTFVAWSDTLFGPYSEKFLMVPHGGGVTVFRGPRSTAVPKFYYPQQAFFLNTVSAKAKPIDEIEKARNDDTLYASFFGNDERAIFRDRPSFLPLEWTGPQRAVEQLFDDCESFPRKPVAVFTERGPWSRMVPLLPDENVRDIKVCVAPNGEYYFSGAVISQPGKLPIWKSKDLAHWEPIGSVWSYEQIEWMDRKLPYGRPDRTDFNHVLWHSWITWWKDTFYITFCVFGDSPGMRGTTALKSTTGRIEGPYVSLGKVGGQFGHDPGPNGFGFFEFKGKLFVSDWHNWRNAFAEADLDAPGWKWQWKHPNTWRYDHMQRGDCYSVTAIDDVPLLSFHSSGKLDNQERQDCTTYDHNFVVMKSIEGPPIGKPFCVPHVMASNIFKDHKGYWWSSMFGSDPTAPWDCRFGLVPLRVEKRGETDLLIDVENKPDAYQLRIIGRGAIAEVKTVQETLVKETP